MRRSDGRELCSGGEGVNGGGKLPAPDSAAGAAGFLFGAAQAFGRVGGGAAGAVEQDRFAEIVIADFAAKIRGAAIGRLAGDLAAADVAGQFVRRRAALAGDPVETDERAV